MIQEDRWAVNLTYTIVEYRKVVNDSIAETLKIAGSNWLCLQNNSRKCLSVKIQVYISHIERCAYQKHTLATQKFTGRRSRFYLGQT